MYRMFQLLATLSVYTLIHSPMSHAEMASDDLITPQIAQELDLTEADELTFTLPTEEETQELAPQVFQDEPELKIDSTRIRIIGRGIQNRQTGDSIALGCVDDDCSQIRSVYFNGATREATFYGKSFFVPKKGASASRKEIKVTVKQINKAYRIYKREDPKVQGRRTRGLFYGGVCMLFCAFLAPLIITKGPEPCRR